VVPRLGTLAGISLLISASTGCLLYTNSINVAPTVSIISPGQVARNVPVTFRAQASDDQSTPLGYAWGAARGGCPASGEPPATAPFASDTAPAFTVTFAESGSYCLFVTVTDDFGASRSATLDVQVDDHPPVAVISRVDATAIAPAPQIPLYTDLHFTGRFSTDPDAGETLAFSWTLAAPGGVAGSPAACAGTPDDACFSVDQPGIYVLGLTARDGDGMTATQTLSLDVAPDHPPCIVATDPPSSLSRIVHDPGLDLTVLVTGVDDDGDPLPAPPARPSMASFVWAWRTGGSGPFVRLADYDLPAYTFPGGSFQSGQTLEVRVEAHDRVARPDELLACYQMQPQPAVCEVAPGCDQWVTWTVELR
jgi:hypothetical protein